MRAQITLWRAAACAAVWALINVGAASAGTVVDVHATGLTPATFSPNLNGGGTLTVDTGNSGFTTKIGANPVIGPGAGTFDLNINFNPVTNNNTATLADAGGTGFGFKLTAPGPETITAAIGVSGVTWSVMSNNTFVSIPSYLLNGSSGVGGLLIEIDNFNPGTQTASSTLTLQADVVGAAADVPLPSTAAASMVLLSGVGAWAAFRRRLA